MSHAIQHIIRHQLRVLADSLVFISPVFQFSLKLHHVFSVPIMLGTVQGSMLGCTISKEITNIYSFFFLPSLLSSNPFLTYKKTIGIEIQKGKEGEIAKTLFPLLSLLDLGG